MALLEITSVVLGTQNKLTFPYLAYLELPVPMIEWSFAFLKTKDGMRGNGRQKVFLCFVFVFLILYWMD